MVTILLLRTPDSHLRRTNVPTTRGIHHIVRYQNISSAHPCKERSRTSEESCARRRQRRKASFFPAHSPFCPLFRKTPPGSVAELRKRAFFLPERRRRRKSLQKIRADFHDACQQHDENGIHAAFEQKKKTEKKKPDHAKVDVLEHNERFMIPERRHENIDA